jgi:hypothetical protein
MVDDVEAVNNFIAAGRSNSTSADTVQINCDYVAYVIFLFPLSRMTLTLFFQLQHGAQPTGWRLLGHPQPTLHHIPSRRAHSLRNRVANVILQSVFPRAWF